MRVADKIFEIVKQYADTVYFVPGGGALHLVDALGLSGLRAVSSISEGGAGFMAIGHAMMSGGLGVCLVTSGPGALNAVPACGAAWMDSVPVLFISGQAKSSTLVVDTGLRTRGIQEIDIVNIIESITKHCWLLTDKDWVVRISETMIKTCLDGRPGPCWLDIPLDIQGEVL